jgi:hypothetical protein
LSFLAMKPSRLETTCSVMIDVPAFLSARDMDFLSLLLLLRISSGYACFHHSAVANLPRVSAVEGYQNLMKARLPRAPLADYAGRS